MDQFSKGDWEDCCLCAEGVNAQAVFQTSHYDGEGKRIQSRLKKVGFVRERRKLFAVLARYISEVANNLSSRGHLIVSPVIACSDSEALGVQVDSWMDQDPCAQPTSRTRIEDRKLLLDRI